MKNKKSNLTLTPTRRQILAFGAATALSTPFVSRAWAAPTEINMLGWYGHGEPDIVAEFEAANNVNFKPKYYAGGDNMLGQVMYSTPFSSPTVRSFVASPINLLVP